MDSYKDKYYGNPFEHAELRYTDPWVYNLMINNGLGYGGGLKDYTFLNPQLNDYLSIPMLAQQLFYRR